MRCFRFVRLLCLALFVAVLPASSIAAVPDGASSASPVISGYGQQGEAQRKAIENPVGEIRSTFAQDAKSTTAAGPNSGVRVNAATRHGKVAAHDDWSGDSGAPSSSDSQRQHFKAEQRQCDCAAQSGQYSVASDAPGASCTQGTATDPAARPLSPRQGGPAWIAARHHRHTLA